MPALREITAFHLVELTEPLGDIPAGARGGVLELLEGDRAAVEITSLPLDAVDRVVLSRWPSLRCVQSRGG